MRKKIIRYFIVLGGFGLLTAFVGEVLLRTFPELRPSSSQHRIESLYKIDLNAESWWIHDDELGFLERPLRDEKIVTRDYSYTRKTDEHGFANARDWPEDVDIVFLGDSLLSGVGVGIEGQFTSLVSERLSGVSVINLGLPGSSPEHLLGIYERFGKLRNPEVVIACLYVASDVDNAKHFDAWKRTGKQWPYEEFRANRFVDSLKQIRGDHAPGPGKKEDDERKTPESSVRSWLKSVVNASELGTELLYISEPVRKNRIHSVDWPDGSEIYLYRRFQNRLENGIGSDYPSIEQIFFEPLTRLRDVVESSGSAFVVALIPSKEEIFAHPDEPGNLRLVDEVRAKLDDLGMETLDLYPTIRRVGEDTAPYYPHDIHLSEAGNRAVAEDIAGWIRSSGVLRRSSIIEAGHNNGTTQ